MADHVKLYFSVRFAAERSGFRKQRYDSLYNIDTVRYVVIVRVSSFNVRTLEPKPNASVLRSARFAVRCMGYA